MFEIIISWVDHKEKVTDVTKSFLTKNDVYLLHRQYVDNDRMICPLVRSSFKGKFSHLDFSENINIKEKHQVQRLTSPENNICYIVH